MKKWILVLCLLVSSAFAIRIKDAAKIQGIEETQLVGYGLVVGLNGTGDGTQTMFTVQSTLNMLRNLGIEVPNEKIKVKNVAAVLVTANLKPFQKPGTKLDINVSSLGDARSLEGGTLIMAPLQGPDREVYALAQGSLTIGGFSQRDSKGRMMQQKNQVLSGLIPNGAIVKKEMLQVALNGKELSYALNSPDFSSAQNMTDKINAKFGNIAEAADAGTITVKIPDAFKNNVAKFVAQAELVEFDQSQIAKIVINEKTGTIVAGADVRISEVAISHGSITVNIQGTNQVSQPNALTQGRTASVIQEQMQMEEPKNEMRVLPNITKVQDLAQALNSLGVTPRDLITIFEAIKQAGALQAELEVM